MFLMLGIKTTDRRGLLKLRKDFMDEVGVDPLQYLTIASVCMAIYRNKDMPEDSIGVIKDNSNDTFSGKSIHWLEYLSQQNDQIFIQHAMNLGEKKIKDVFVTNDFNTNEYIAASTTANARMRLYEKLDELGEAIVHLDTDSAVYIDNNKNTVKTGNKLGEWTLEAEFDHWVSTDPKTYSYLDVFIDKVENLIDEDWSEKEL
uniref:DNA-directed DNA polymerase n=1 Tax=Heterorhabditis bacteriophora TaxID=37862 RepID=A0A1I7XHL1_HETBA